VRACLEVAVSRPEFWVVFVEFWGEMLHDRRLRDLNTAVYSRTRRLIGRLIAEGVRAGRFRPVDPRRASAVVLGLIDGLSLQLTFDPEAFGVAEAARFCDDALGRYLARETP
jgi:type VI protein secretion system component VasA